jgi:hypothetical protein
MSSPTTFLYSDMGAIIEVRAFPQRDWGLPLTVSQQCCPPGIWFSLCQQRHDLRFPSKDKFPLNPEQRRWILGVPGHY